MARLTAAQFQRVTRARYGLAPRPPKSEVPSITRRDYAYVLDRWAAFDRFKAWRDRGGPRPAGVWKIVPRWDGWTPWDLLKEIRAKWPLEKVEPHPVPAPSPPAFKTAFGQSWFVIAQDYREAWSGPDYFGRAFVADPGYEHPTREEVAAYRARGVRTATWGDSREEGDGTPPAAIVGLANELRVDAPMFQAELGRECRAALRMMDRLGGDGHLLIVNLSQIRAEDGALHADLSTRIRRGNVLAIVECYKNCGWGDPDWQGLPCASTLAATYRDGQCQGCSMDAYYSNGWVGAHRDSFYTAQWRSADYARAR